jgi:hypothetical protein
MIARHSVMIARHRKPLEKTIEATEEYELD